MTALFTAAELEHHLRPLLCEQEVNAQEAAAAAVFSHLCEPGDQAHNLFLEHIDQSALLQLLVARASAKAASAAFETFQVQQIEESFGQPFEVLWRESCERWLPRLSKNEFIANLDHAKALGLRLVPKPSHFYPNRFEVLEAGQPDVIWAKGNVDLLNAPAIVAIVGSRNTSVYGRNVATDLAVVAADHNIVTVSGGAFGIDACAHQASLDAGGATIAVMAGGLGRLYPMANLELLQNVAREGLLISELPPKVAPAKWRFLMRNRLIAALGDATVMVQAGIKSGAMSTARKAQDLHKTVAVVPGQINSAFHIGCHRFVNEFGGTQLITNSADLPYLLKATGNLGPLPPNGLGVLETRAFDAFQPGENSFEQLLKESGLTSNEGAIALGSLQLEGLVERFGAGYRKVAI